MMTKRVIVDVGGRKNAFGGFKKKQKKTTYVWVSIKNDFGRKKNEDWRLSAGLTKFYHGPYFEHPWSTIADIFQLE